MHLERAKVIAVEIADFRSMYIAELQELASVESQLTEALLWVASVASHPHLKNALINHRAQSQVQQERLESLLRQHNADTSAHVDQSMEALIQEAEKVLSTLKGDDLRDAGIIGSAQRLEHYEIAAYGTAAALAGQLGLPGDQRILHQTLEEEKRADSVLTDIAKCEVNRDAAAAQAPAA